MNPTEIYDALDEIASAPFDAAEFPFVFAEATDNARATISKLRNGSTNKSDIAGGVLLNRKFHYAPAPRGGVGIVLDCLRASRRTASAKPAILVTTDGEEVAAEHVATGDPLHCRFDEISNNYLFFLPAAGKERYKPEEESPLDVGATGKLAKLYDALIKANPEWAGEARRHTMNQLMMRLIFCLFAEDVGIFPEGQFSRLVFTHAGERGEEAREVIVAAFRAMNLPKDARPGLPGWTAEIEYVNGGLFAGEIDAPRFDPIAFRYLKDAARLNWREINPDIFGSMIQSVADPKKRSELGMHYTSVPNIIRVLGPLFLDDIDTEITKAWDKPRALQRVIDRMAGIRVFDPACGSGNFLVVAYRELRARETRVLARIAELEGRAQTLMFSSIPIAHFCGIEIADFAAETAKLALFIAEYQANAKFGEVFGQMPASLPLREAARIVCDNALRTDWETVCPPPTPGEQIYIFGNPPFVGTTYRTVEQRADMACVFGADVENHGRLDFSATWMYRAAQFVRRHGAKSALITTSSTVQGAAVGPLWSRVLTGGVEIVFAHRPFKWRNNAAKNAAVECVIVGLSSRQESVRLFDADTSKACSSINAYLIDGPRIFVDQTREGLFSLPEMGPGNFPYDFGHLILSPIERDDLIARHPQADHFIYRFVGADEVINGIDRFCLWIDDDDLKAAMAIPEIAMRIGRVAADRSNSSDAGTRRLAARPHQFREHVAPTGHMLLMPRTSSEKREWLPVDRSSGKVVSSDNNHVVYDAPDWCFAMIASRLHLVWIATVCGRLEARFRYSNTLGWNTFPTPGFTDAQKEQLSVSARQILKTRYAHYPKTIAELYDPVKMPDDLRAIHKANDDLLETMYIGRPFRNDSERLERLFKLYAARVKKEG